MVSVGDPPCLFREAFDVNGKHVGFQVKFFFMFDGAHTYQFLRREDMEFNHALASECDIICFTFDKWILVNKRFCPILYDQILKFLHRVPLSDLYPEPLPWDPDGSD